jgi:hypothetical protein
MREIASYIVRVYRRSARGIAGVVEDVQTGCVHSFHSAIDLWQVLGTLPPNAQRKDESHENQAPGPAGRRGPRRRL